MEDTTAHAQTNTRAHAPVELVLVVEVALIVVADTGSPDQADVEQMASK